jgi:hypothetical protein
VKKFSQVGLFVTSSERMWVRWVSLALPVPDRAEELKKPFSRLSIATSADRLSDIHRQNTGDCPRKLSLTSLF